MSASSAIVKEATVSIRMVQINNRKLTYATYEQIPFVSAIKELVHRTLDPSNLSDRGHIIAVDLLAVPVWGWVNRHGLHMCGVWPGAHLHVLYTDSEGILKRTHVVDGSKVTAPRTGEFLENHPEVITERLYKNIERIGQLYIAT